jgi:hypothetical protein
MLCMESDHTENEIEIDLIRLIVSVLGVLIGHEVKEITILNLN